MRDQIIVSLDLETTGLDEARDAIIQVGAVKFRGDEILETFNQLVDPCRPIPRNISQLTGITDSDVTGAPLFEDVLPYLEKFCGDAPILGQNVWFDLGFLTRHGFDVKQPPMDTYELASVMLPTAPRYNLGALANRLGVELEQAHNAMDDALATRGIFLALWDRILELPLGTLEEIVGSSRGLNWPARPVFEAALQKRAREAFGEGSQREPYANLIALFGPSEEGWEVLRPNAIPEPIDIDAAAAMLAAGGVVADAMPDYESRQEQVAMMRAIAKAFNEGEHLMVEAGTGTGKSLAYLLPAVLWATQNNQRVVISTNTINLQDQLYNKDLPTLKAALGIDFSYSVLKGRSNYLCPRRLATLRRRPPTSPEEMRLFAKILVWLQESTTGDRNEISLRGGTEYAIWARLSAEDEGCTLDRCMSQMDGACPFYKARRAAEGAHVLIVNHALLLSDVQAGNRVLPEYDLLVVDEAHHLEDATTNGLSFNLDQYAFKRQLSDLGTRSSGLMGDLLARCQGSIPDGFYEKLEAYVMTVEQAVSAMTFHVDAFFRSLLNFVRDFRGLRGSSEYATQVRIVEKVRHHHGWAQIELVWDRLSYFTEGIADAMSQLSRGLSQLDIYDIPDYMDLVNSIAAAGRHVQDIHVNLNNMITQPDANTIYWINIASDHERISVHTAPLHVGPLIREHIWNRKYSTVLTSATLQTALSFDYIQDRLDAEDVDTLALGSPFDYESSTLLYLVTDIALPNERGAYQHHVEQGLIELCKATNGRALVLFTSYAQLRQTAKAISPELEAEGIVVYDQSSGTSRQQLIEGFRGTENAVLLGTRSFWEGVDVPGQALSVLVIVRLPFSVPSDPIFEARSKTFDQPFQEYAVPEAILHFRQGFGRLIRRKTDRGVVVLFDRRVLAKSYGKHFLSSLPDCTRRYGPMSDLPRAAAEWIDGKR